MRGLARLFDALADFQPTIAGHVNIKDDQIRLLLGNFLQRRGPVVNRYDFVSRVSKDLPPHILGGDAIVGEQYLPGQRLFPLMRGDNAKVTRRST